MQVRLLITAGPHKGKEFFFEQHDTFLVGRTKDCHLQLSYDDPYFSRRHFLIELHPPRVRVIDLNSRNGVYLNGNRIDSSELKAGDELQAGHTKFLVHLEQPEPEDVLTLNIPGQDLSQTADYVEHEDVGEQKNLSAISQPAEEYVEETVKAPRRINPLIAGIIASQEDSQRQSRVDDKTIRGYEIKEELGRGAMGVVHKAVRVSDGTIVAIKSILPAMGVGRRQIEKFVREAKVLAALHHVNIVRYLEQWESDGTIHLVMEYVRGTNGAQILKERGPLDVRLAVRMTCQLLSGLAHAHDQGFVHRDVKPSNIMVAGEAGKRVIKLADFGLARAFDDCKLSGLTMMGEVGGTPAFMPPEQVTHYRTVRPFADQYSAAATLYNLLTDKFPLDLAKNTPSQLAQIVASEIVPIRNRRSDIPKGLAKVIETALSRDQEARFKDVREFRIALLPYAQLPAEK